MTADEIVRKLHKDYELLFRQCNGFECRCATCHVGWGNLTQPDHKPNCLWLEIEEYANPTCGSFVIGITGKQVHCELPQHHKGDHRHKMFGWQE